MLEGLQKKKKTMQADLLQARIEVMNHVKNLTNANLQECVWEEMIVSISKLNVEGYHLPWTLRLGLMPRRAEWLLQQLTETKEKDAANNLISQIVDLFSIWKMSGKEPADIDDTACTAADMWKAEVQRMASLQSLGNMSTEEVEELTAKQAEARVGSTVPRPLVPCTAPEIRKV